MSLNDGEQRLVCPFNIAHYIIKSRMATHLTQCAKNYPSSPLRICPFNGLHYMDYKDFQKHVDTCPDKIYAERFVYKSGPQARDVTELVLTDVAVDAEDDWDKVDCDSYLGARDEAIQKKPVFIMGQLNAGKAARKAYIKSEKERMQKLAEGPAAGRCGDNGAGNFNPPQPPRGRGRGAHLA